VKKNEFLLKENLETILQKQKNHPLFMKYAKTIEKKN
jgi:hypothetical protein